MPCLALRVGNIRKHQIIEVCAQGLVSSAGSALFGGAKSCCLTLFDALCILVGPRTCRVG